MTGRWFAVDVARQLSAIRPREADTIPLKRLKIGAVVRGSVGKAWDAMSDAFPYRELQPPDDVQRQPESAELARILDPHPDSVDLDPARLDLGSFLGKQPHLPIRFFNIVGRRPECPRDPQSPSIIQLAQPGDDSLVWTALRLKGLNQSQIRLSLPIDLPHVLAKEHGRMRPARFTARRGNSFTTSRFGSFAPLLE